MLIEVDWQSNILFQERIPEVSNSPLEYLVDFEIRMKVFFGLIVAMCCIQCPQMVEFLSGVEGILIVVDVDMMSFVADLLVKVHWLMVLGVDVCFCRTALWLLLQDLTNSSVSSSRSYSSQLKS